MSDLYAVQGSHMYTQLHYRTFIAKNDLNKWTTPIPCFISVLINIIRRYALTVIYIYPINSTERPLPPNKRPPPI